jgi:hypothetical protein
MVTENKMYVLCVSATFVENVSHSKNNWAKYGKECALVFM